MKRARWGSGLGVLLISSVSLAQWESGSDGSDGAFNPAVSTEVDLSLAASLCDCDGDSQIDDPCRWDCPSPVPGRGIYDAEQWVIVFKYSTVNVPSGVTVTFKNHPSNPPVVWLATGNVTIAGTVNLNGKPGVTNAPIPTFVVPGPGGYEGAQSGHAGLGTGSSFYAHGFGPGANTNDVQGASHSTPGGNGPLYGNANAQPLTGGSGAGAPPNAGSLGGSGAGAILVASTTSISLTSSGSIQAAVLGGPGNQGSGGTIRLRAESVTLPSGSSVWAFNADGLGQGWVRIEAFSLTNNASFGFAPLSVTNIPSVVFVPNPPQLRIVTICGETTPVEPTFGIMSVEAEFNSGSPCSIGIEAENIPAGTTVGVRVIPARGPAVTATSSPLAAGGGGILTATASLTFPPGRSEVQLRANW